MKTKAWKRKGIALLLSFTLAATSVSAGSVSFAAEPDDVICMAESADGEILAGEAEAGQNGTEQLYCETEELPPEDGTEEQITGEYVTENAPVDVQAAGAETKESGAAPDLSAGGEEEIILPEAGGGHSARRA